MRHGITQCYLPPGRGDIPEAGERAGMSPSVLCLQCFDAVGWATGRASGL